LRVSLASKKDSLQLDLALYILFSAPCQEEPFLLWYALEAVKKMNFSGKGSFARKNGSLGETSERHLSQVNSRGFNDNNFKHLLPRQVFLMTLRDPEVAI
jgi:hypothetical protein